MEVDCNGLLVLAMGLIQAAFLGLPVEVAVVRVGLFDRVMVDEIRRLL